jgi:type II secretory pathway pseudopilin PulG
MLLSNFMHGHVKCSKNTLETQYSEHNAMMSRRWHSERGFTLVEAVLSVMILGIALGACVFSFNMAMNMSGASRNQMFALNAARAQLEYLRTLSYANSALNVGTYGINTNNASSGYYTNYWGKYTVTANGYPGVKDITVAICYQNYPRDNISTNTLTTSVSKTLHP